MVSKRIQRALGLVCLALGLVASSCAKKEETAAGPTAKGAARGETKVAHVTLTGDYLYDTAARAVCVFLPTKAFEVTFDSPGMPWVVLRIPNFTGAGNYEAESRLRANYSGEGIRQSKGVAKAEIRVDAKGANGGLASGTFTGEFAGMGGKGTAAGSFEGCEYHVVAEAMTAPTPAQATTP
jgi:hypothetical protein